MCRLFAGLKIAHGDQYATQLLFNLAQDKLESETDEGIIIIIIINYFDH